MSFEKIENNESGFIDHNVLSCVVASIILGLGAYIYNIENNDNNDNKPVELLEYHGDPDNIDTGSQYFHDRL